MNQNQMRDELSGSRIHQNSGGFAAPEVWRHQLQESATVDENQRSDSKLRITIFSLPKPFTDPHIDLIQRNAIRSWTALGPDVDVILMGDEDGIERAAGELNVRHHGSIRKNEQGTPLLSDAFRAAAELSAAEVLVYCNCDVILLNDLLASLRFVQSSEAVESFVAFGRRIDLDVENAIDFSNQNEIVSLLDEVRKSGSLAPVVCKEYFAFTREQFRDLPDFAVGRGNWDNWMVAHAKTIGLPVIDLSKMVKAVHQSHNYSHVNKSRMQVYVSGQEAKQNQSLAGGRNVIGGSTGTWSLTANGLQKNRMNWANKRFWMDLPRFLKLIFRFPFQK